MSADGSHITAPDEQGRGAARAMMLALRDAKLDASSIDYINAHGTSTGLGDLAETRAMKSIFGSHAAKLMVSSTKSQLGHLLGASGGVEMVACCLAMERNVLPPTINLENPDEECDLDYIPRTPREAKVDYVMSNSFGFGGHNASLVIGRYGVSR
jgi:3-oxoacyl-[acyl-carrier-protein] synthase II